jgi:putative dimethyl sulfoxide reductase chaperone
MATEPQTYEFLAQALLYPDASFAEKIEGRGRALSVLYPWAREMVDALAGETLEYLQVEHVRLFVNAYGGARCLPYESVYAEGQILGEAAQEVANLYAQWGVEETAEMPDHAAVELAFAAQLARLQPILESDEDRRRAGQALEAFERDHLRAWLPALAADLYRAAEVGFYRELGQGLDAIFGSQENSGRKKQAGGPIDPYMDMAT